MNKLIFKIRNDKTSEGELFNKKQNENKERLGKDIKEENKSSVFYTKNDFLDIFKHKNCKKVHKTHTNKDHICLLKDLNNNCIKLHEIKSKNTRTINDEFYTLVERKINHGIFSKLILSDQTDKIIGFTNIHGINTGDILLLKNCGFWIGPDKSLNILKENVKKVIKNKN